MTIKSSNTIILPEDTELVDYGVGENYHPGNNDSKVESSLCVFTNQDNIE